MAVLTADVLPVHVGVDVGQLHDPTAICVTEIEARATGKHRYVEPVPAHMDERGQWVLPVDTDPIMASHYTVRHIARLPLGTSYPDVALALADVLCSPLLVGRKVRVLIDVTGVGRPVYEDLLQEIDRRKYGTWARNTQNIWEPRPPQPEKTLRCDVAVKPISFVHGETYNRRSGSLGKAYLVSRLQSLLQAVRVHAPDTSEMKATLDELRVYEIKIDQNGKDTYGAKTGAHDDLATALGLSCLEDPFADQVRYSKRVY